MSVGQELLDVPLPQMVEKLGMGISKAQHSLDKNSVDVAKELANTKIDVIPQITRTIKQNGEVEYESPDPIEMSLLEAGINPTFYQFSEATIEVEMDIKTKTSKSSSFSVSTKHEVDVGVYSGSVQADYEHNRKFGKEVQGTSRMVTKLQPVPTPDMLRPDVETVDNRNQSQDNSN